MLTTIIVTVIVTLLLAVIASNLSSSELRIQHRVEHLYGVEDEQFERSIGNLLPPGFTSDNRIKVLENGDVYFPVMLEAIRNARETINMETFIFWSGDIGTQFADALIERAKAGIEVRLLIDWIGSFRASRALIRKMRRSGVVVVKFRPPRIIGVTQFNNRTHRKILVIDGRLGFTGGAGIADAWKGRARTEENWRDSQYQVEGPLVWQLQSAFMDNWLQTRAEVLHDAQYFPPLEGQGDMRAQVFTSGPQEGLESARLMYLISIACAKRRILLAHGYFVPDDLCVQALIDAIKRGVEVELIMAGPTDAHLVRRATINRLGRLLKAGMKVQVYQTAMFHRKLMLVDDCWTSVGSANFDNRSFRINDEVCLNVLDGDFGKRMAESFEADKKCCEPLTLEEWNDRPMFQKVVDWCCALLRSQL